MKNKLIVFAFLTLFSLIFAGCGEQQKYYAGEKVSPDDIARYSEEIFTEENKPTEETASENTATSDNKIVDIITTDDITTTESHIFDTLEIDTGNTEPEPETDPIIDTQIYFWTPSGTKYHIYRDCGYLANSDTVLSGTLEEGMAAGKSGLCKNCEKKLNNN